MSAFIPTGVRALAECVSAIVTHYSGFLIPMWIHDSPGRPRLYADDLEKQRAYRARKKEQEQANRADAMRYRVLREAWGSAPISSLHDLGDFFLLLQDIANSPVLEDAEHHVDAGLEKFEEISPLLAETRRQELLQKFDELWARRRASR